MSDSSTRFLFYIFSGLFLTILTVIYFRTVTFSFVLFSLFFFFFPDRMSWCSEGMYCPWHSWSTCDGITFLETITVMISFNRFWFPESSGWLGSYVGFIIWLQSPSPWVWWTCCIILDYKNAYCHHRLSKIS